jgi:hypothetical protein
MKQLITLLIVLAYQGTVYARPAITIIGTTTIMPPSCPNVLNLCKTLVDSQNELITQLNANQKVLEQHLEAKSEPLLPWWAWAGLGVVAGFAVGKGAH